MKLEKTQVSTNKPTISSSNIEADISNLSVTKKPAQNCNNKKTGLSSAYKADPDALGEHKTLSEHEPQTYKNKKKIDLRTPKGTTDFSSTDCLLLNQILSTCETHLSLYSIPLDTPTFELTDILLSKYDTAPDEHLNTYKLADQGGDDCTLRYDLTVPFGRYLAQHNILKYNRYQIGKVFRRDQPSLSTGRYREFYQCDYDIAGNYSVMTSEALILQIITELLVKFKVKNKFIVRINDRRILNLILEQCGVQIKDYHSILSTIDKMNKVTYNALVEELTEKGMVKENINTLLKYINHKGSIYDVSLYLENTNLNIKEILAEYKLLNEYILAYNINENFIVFDLSLARGAAYYTGMIFEAEYLNTEHNSELSYNNQMVAQSCVNTSSAASDNKFSLVGSVVGGGRYDNLVTTFKPTLNVPCIGFSVGIYRIFSLLKSSSSTYFYKNNKRYLVCAAISNLNIQRMNILSLLWKSGIKASSNFVKRVNLSEQIKFAKLNNYWGVVILLPEEIERGVVKIIKNFYENNEITEDFSTEDKTSAHITNINNKEVEVKVEDMCEYILSEN
ncbi:Histidine--tRNA ligase, cytoplasmic [Cucumispora dikerogammari]|nr:Histidine--tRNA ligase, cytoplasmic [Cucumispora dikerogammari]